LAIVCGFQIVANYDAEFGFRSSQINSSLLGQINLLGRCSTSEELLGSNTLANLFFSFSFDVYVLCSQFKTLFFDFKI